ncbi:hypothetical protein UPYG_G00016980 [Umbra pygmaea]|uniref:Uncharacterized protein n=1 Tax=Umbra pygmaea TaxID=75934 RepID=A0ABD0XJX4_UMBPY
MSRASPYHHKPTLSPRHHWSAVGVRRSEPVLHFRDQWKEWEAHRGLDCNISTKPGILFCFLFNLIPFGQERARVPTKTTQFGWKRDWIAIIAETSLGVQPNLNEVYASTTTTVF